MSLSSRYAGTCRKCGAKWKAGDMITKKKGWEKWCANENCTQDPSAEEMIRRGQTVMTAPAGAHQKHASDYDPADSLPPVAGLDYDMIRLIEEKTAILYRINSHVKRALARHEQQPNPAMVGQFTKIIYDDLKKGNNAL